MLHKKIRPHPPSGSGPSSDVHMPSLNATVTAEEDIGSLTIALDTSVWLESSWSLTLTCIPSGDNGRRVLLEKMM